MSRRRDRRNFLPYRVFCLIWERGHSHDLIFSKLKSRKEVERHLRATEPPRPGQVDPRWVVGEGAPQSLALTARMRARARHFTTHSAPRDVARAQQHWLSHLLASSRGPTVACQ
eukprot:scaffold81045_cov42-Phaeocystis_antarctica.AAC.1